jgi:hypothetical protein
MKFSVFLSGSGEGLGERFVASSPHSSVPFPLVERGKQIKFAYTLEFLGIDYFQ